MPPQTHKSSPPLCLPGAAALRLLLLTTLPMLAMSCTNTEPQPTPEEVRYHDAWAALVPPQRRVLVEADAARHTSWSPRKRVLWEGQTYQRIVEHEDRRARAAQPTTKDTLSTTGPTTRHLATTRHLSTTMHAVSPTTGPVTQPATQSIVPP